MKSEVVLNSTTFLGLQEEILKISKEHEYSSLLSKNMIDEYYYLDMKKDIAKVFTKFNDMKYIVGHSNNYDLSSVSFDTLKVSLSKKNNDKVSNYVMKNVDLEIWTQDFYNTIISLSRSLTMQEGVYLVDALFANRSEEMISEKICVCRKTLQSIKKSCLVKLYLELKYSNLM